MLIPRKTTRRGIRITSLIKNPAPILVRKAKRAGVPMQHRDAKIDPSHPIIFDAIITPLGFMNSQSAQQLSFVTSFSKVWAQSFMDSERVG
jgi:hypothetical protein